MNDKDEIVLQSLKDDLGIKSNPDLLAELLVLANWLVSERRAGRKIVSCTDDGLVRELASPLLDRIARESQLPRIEIDWTEDELRDLARLAAQEAPSPTPALVRAMS